MKLILGTVNMGMPYGLPGREKMLEKEVSFKILEIAYELGIRHFDTAEAYGIAESLLGEFIKANQLSDINVSTKLLPNLKHPYVNIEEHLVESLKRLNIDKTWVYYLHTPGDMYSYEVMDDMLELCLSDLTENTGVSVYSREDGEEAKETVDVVQFPMSVLDRRFADFSKGDCIAVCRTIFLKGLLTSPTPPEEFTSHIEKYREVLKWHGFTPAQGAINYIRQVNNCDYVVIGVSSVEQLIEDIDLFNNVNYQANIESSLAPFDPAIFNSLWAVSNDGFEDDEIFKMRHGRK